MTTANAEQHDLMSRFGDDFALGAVADKDTPKRYRQPSKKALASGDTRRRIEAMLEQKALNKQFEL